MKTPEEISMSSLSTMPLPRLEGVTDKAGRGRVLVVGGGERVPGAVMLTGLAALRSGAGRLQIASTASAVAGLGLCIPEAAVSGLACDATTGELSPQEASRLEQDLDRVDAVIVGPGMMDPGSAGALALRLMERSSIPFVLDAAAMTGLDYDDSRVRALAGRLVLTPHAGEMARLRGVRREQVAEDPLAMARRMAAEAGAVVVMKGAESHVVSPDGRAWLHRAGVVGLATSGSGDVLAGVIGGLLARGAAPVTAAAWGVCVHGAAGARLSERVGPVGFLARELLGEIPRVLAQAPLAGAP